MNRQERSGTSRLGKGPRIAIHAILLVITFVSGLWIGGGANAPAHDAERASETPSRTTADRTAPVEPLAEDTSSKLDSPHPEPVPAERVSEEPQEQAGADVAPAEEVQFTREVLEIAGVIISRSEGTGIAGVQVRIVAPEEDASQARSQSPPAAISGPGGEFGLPLPPRFGEYVLLFDHPEYLPHAEDVEVSERRRVDLGTVILSRGGTIAGTVRSARGDVLSGAEVSLNVPERTTTTSEDGSYRFDLLLEGPYAVRARAPGFEETRSEAEVVEGEEARVDLALDPAGESMQGVVVDEESGPPIPGVQFFAGEQLLARSGNEGEFTVTLPSGMPRFLELYHPDYETLTLEFEPESGIRVPLKRARGITGRVFRASTARQQPLSGELFLLLEIDRSTGVAFYAPELTSLRVVAREGYFRLEPSSFMRTIRRAHQPDYSSPDIEVVVPTEAGTQLAQDLVLSRRPGLEVFGAWVFDASNGQPIPGVRFFIDHEPHETLEEQIAQRPVTDSPLTVFYTTNASGTIDLPDDIQHDLERNPIYLTFLHPRYVIRSIKVSKFPPTTSPRGSRFEVRLERGGSIAGSINLRNAYGTPGRPHLQLERMGSDYSGKHAVFLDAAGGFQVTGLPPGHYRLRCRRASHQIEVTPGTTAELRLP